tara:strand:- start:313 stop:516 length:204 start_codon:yes stop_codon:yes gene_type:complete
LSLFDVLLAAKKELVVMVKNASLVAMLVSSSSLSHDTVGVTQKALLHAKEGGRKKSDFESYYYYYYY